MGKHSEEKTKSKSKVLKVFLRILLVLLIIFVILAGIAAGFVANKLGKINVENIDETAIGISEETKEELSGYRNIALFGVDSRADDYGLGNRSDCIMIASMNQKTNDIKIISVYRDTYVQVEEKGKEKLDKITHAYAYGGPQGALKALNTNLDLNISEYVTANFDAVIAAVDAVGGVTIDVDSSEIKYINKYINDLIADTNGREGTAAAEITKAGKQTLTGAQALAYSRVRYTEGGDYKRTERMRTVIEAMLSKVKTLNIGQLNKFVDTILPKISTNISSTEILGLAPSIASYNITDSLGWPYETKGITLDRWYGVPITLQSNVEQLHKEVFDQKDYVANDTIKDISNQIIKKTNYKYQKRQEHISCLYVCSNKKHI